MAVASIGGSKANSSSSSSTGVASGYTYQRFTASGNIVMPTGYAGNGGSTPLVVDVISVGGGGGGGGTPGYNSGGGGAGDLVIASGISLTSATSVTVGAAGSAGTQGGTSMLNLPAVVSNYAKNPCGRYGDGSSRATGWSGGTYSSGYYNTSGSQVGLINGISGSLPTRPSAAYPVNGYVVNQYTTNVAFTMGYTMDNLTVGTAYAVSFWYARSTNGGGSINSPYITINGANVGSVTMNQDVWYQYTGTFTATSTSAFIGWGGTNAAFNITSMFMGYLRVIEATASNPYVFGGIPYDGTGLYVYTGGDGTSTIASTASNPTRATGGNPGGVYNSTGTQSTCYAPSNINGGSIGGNGYWSFNNDNTSPGIACATPATGVYRNSGGGSSRSQFPYGNATTYVVNKSVTGGGGGAMGAGTGVDNWQSGVGGNGGAGYDANPWCGSSTTQAINLLAGGGAGWGSFGVGTPGYGGGTPSVNAPFNTSITMRAAIPATDGTGGGGYGGSNTTPSGAGGSGIVIIRYKA